MTNITVQILSQNNTEYVCYSVCSFILPTSLQFAHTSTGSVNVEIHTASGEILIQSQLFEIDEYVANPMYEISQSTNVTGLYIGEHSELIFESQEPAKQFCISIQSRTEQSCSYNISQLAFSPPQLTNNENLTFRVNVTDYYDNFAETFVTLTYVANAPNLTSEFYTNSGAGWIEIQTNSIISYSIEVFGNISQTSTNGSIFVNTVGNHTENCRIIDSVGNIRNCTITVVFDNTDPLASLSLPSSIFVGYNSNLQIELEDLDSLIKYYSLSVTDNITNCTIGYDVSIHSNISNHTLEDLIGQQSCQLPKNANYQVTLELIARNEVGRLSVTSINTTYFGIHESGNIGGYNYSHSPNGAIFVSGHTTLMCTTTHPVQTNLTVIVQGGNAVLEQNNDLKWINGSGIVSCFYNDIFENKWNQSWNVNYIANTTSATITTLNGYANITKLGFSNIHYSINSSKELSRVEISVDGIVQHITQNSQGVLQINTTSGGHMITLNATTVLGYSTTESLYVFFDGDAPYLTIDELPDYYVNLTQQKIITKMNTVAVSATYFDTMCGSNNTIQVENATIMSMSNQNTILNINTTTTEFNVSITDCVGWNTVKSYQVIRKTNIQPLNHYNTSNMFIDNLTISIGQSGSFELSTIDPLTVNLSCSTSTGEINCFKIITFKI